MEEIIKKAQEFAYSEIEKFGSPSRINLDTSHEKGIELANKLGANMEVVKLGTLLMDIKLGEAKSIGKIGEHVKMSAAATQDFLSQFEVSNKVKEQIVDCVNCHHGRSKYNSIESEICANADCYRFLKIKNWLYFFYDLAREGNSIEKCLDQAKFKFEEKKNALSLPICKEELQNDIETISGIINNASKTS